MSEDIFCKTVESCSRKVKYCFYLERFSWFARNFSKHFSEYFNSDLAVCQDLAFLVQ